MSNALIQPDCRRLTRNVSKCARSTYIEPIGKLRSRGITYRNGQPFVMHSSNQWCRQLTRSLSLHTRSAYIERLHPKEPRFEVRFLDYGNAERLPAERIRKMEAAVAAVAPQAQVRCIFGGRCLLGIGACMHGAARGDAAYCHPFVVPVLGSCHSE